MQVETPPPVMASDKVPKNFSRVALSTTCGILWLVILLKCVFCIDESFDSWWYHLPFAARIVQISDSNSYNMGPWLESCYKGFPLLGELFQGIAWKLTGRVECANLANAAALFLFCGLCRKAFGIPFRHLSLCLLTIPLVQIHATRCHVDLFSGCFLAFFALGVYNILVYGPMKPKFFVAMLSCGAVATNSKFFAAPVLALGYLCLLLRWYFKGYRSLAKESSKKFIVAMLSVFLFASAFTCLKNALTLGNPVYPVSINFLGARLPGMQNVERPPSNEGLDRLPKPVQWFISVSELNYLINGRLQRNFWPYSIDMNGASTQDRTGGFFGPLVALEILFFAFLHLRRGPENSRAPDSPKPGFYFFVALSFSAAYLPQSIELRYSLFWILFLIGANIQRLTLYWHSDRLRRHYYSIHYLALVFLLAWSHLAAFRSVHWTRKPWVSLETYRDHYAKRNILDRLEQEKKPVVLHNFSPHSILYSRVFQTGSIPPVTSWDGNDGPGPSGTIIER